MLKPGGGERTDGRLNIGKYIVRVLCLCLCVILLAGTGRAEEKKERLPDAQLMRFYDNSLFVGDSQIRNFGNYLRKLRREDPDIFAGVKCFGAYSLQMRTLGWEKPSSDENEVQLTYKGRNATLTGIAKAEEPRMVFILVGMNDKIYEHTDRADGYFDKILLRRDEFFPETEICFLSLTPVTDRNKERIRDKINEYNEWLKAKCGQTGATYIDVTAGLADDNGWLPKEITSDADCHLNDKGFDIFIRNLLDYAQSRYEAGTWDPAEE